MCPLRGGIGRSREWPPGLAARPRVPRLRVSWGGRAILPARGARPPPRGRGALHVRGRGSRLLADEAWEPRLPFVRDIVEGTTRRRSGPIPRSRCPRRSLRRSRGRGGWAARPSRQIALASGGARGPAGGRWGTPPLPGGLARAHGAAVVWGRAPERRCDARGSRVGRRAGGGLAHRMGMVRSKTAERGAPPGARAGDRPLGRGPRRPS